MIRRLTTTAVLIVLVTALGWAVRAEAPSPDAAREAAYRENNLGVALLEQYNHKEAAEAFGRALEADPGLGLAQVNRALALFYIPDLAAARDAATAAREKQPDSLHLRYLLALIARLEDQPAVAEEHLRAVLAADPADFGANLVLGQLLVDETRYDEAMPVLDAAAAADPVNASAAYSRAMALGRSGQREKAMEAMKHFQALRANPAHTSFGKIYLEQGRYAEAIVSTGAEDELVDPATPKVAFREKADAVPSRPASDRGVTLALADLDGDGDLDAVEAGAQGVRILKNDGGRFQDATEASGVSGPAVAAVGGDYDNDGVTDLLVIRPKGPSLYRGEGEGRFADVTATAALPANEGLPATAAFADVDHDGDLDVVVPGLLLRNNGDGTFADVTREAGVGVEGEALAVVPTDYDNGRDLDLLVLRRQTAPLLFRNLRDGRFEDVAAAVGIEVAGPFASLAAADINKDFYPDLVLGTEGTATLALSDGRGRFRMAPAPAGSGGAGALGAFDYDNDGLVDLLAAAETGARLYRNLGSGWADVSEAALPTELRAAALGGAALAVADLDHDGDPDVLLGTTEGTSLWVNEGGSAHNSFAVDLEGRVSNKSAVGAKVTLRAGSLKQKIETSAAVPMAGPGDVVFGLGSRAAPDTVRVIWVSGIVQTETAFPEATTEATRTTSHLLELDRKPSSCPYLYAWDGERLAFVTDFLGAGEMGYWVAPGVRSHPDPREYVRIAADQLQAKDGRYELRVTNELEEVLYLDEVRLLAVEHPEGVEVYPDEGMTGTPKEFRLFAVRDARVPGVVDAAGGDATARASAVDRRFVEGFALHRIRGYAAEHALTLDLSDLPATHRVLLLTGWTDYAFSSDNVAAAQMGLGLQPPRLEVETAPGRWEVAVADVGIPVGRPQTVVVDLATLALGESARVRLVTNMRIYWDRIAVGEAVPDTLAEPVSLEPTVARLSERGFSAERFVDGKGPLSFEYARVGWASPWKVMPGRYTRVGDVRDLLGATDDLFVVSKPGDLVTLSFEALPPARPGHERTFLLLGDGFSKEMDINSSSPDAVLPLPFHGMTRYPYGQTERPRRLVRQDALQEKYNTRVVARPLVPLELAGRWERDARP